MVFLGRPYRKKRALLLPCLPDPKKKPPMSWRPPVHNAPGIERNFYEACYRTHAASCGCGDLLGHITRLVDRYGTPPRPGPPTDPPPRLRALPAPPPAPSRNQDPVWPGGDGGDAGGAAPGGDAAADDPYAADEIEQLMAAAEEDAQ